MTSQSAIEDLIYNLTTEAGVTPLQQEALKTAGELDLLLFMQEDVFEPDEYTRDAISNGRLFLRRLRKLK